MISRCRIVLIPLLLCVSGTGALYFHLSETAKKCFIEDVPADTLVLGVYKVETYDRIQGKYTLTVAGFGMKVQVMNEDKSTLMERTYGAEGRFTFTSENSGQHTICLHSNTTAWFSSSLLRVHLDIRVGEATQDYKIVAVKGKLSDIQLRIRQLLDQAEQIMKEQEYQRSREERFRQTSDSTNMRVLGWAFTQSLLLLLVGLLQLHHLRRFFEKKKLI